MYYIEAIAFVIEAINAAVWLHRLGAWAIGRGL